LIDVGVVFNVRGQIQKYIYKVQPRALHKKDFEVKRKEENE
jgi:hypothetical protein